MVASSSPTRAKDKPQEGEVISVGQRQDPTTKAKCSRSPSKKATAFCSASTAGTEIKLDGEDFVIMREEEVLGILVGAPAKKEPRVAEVSGYRKQSLQPRAGMLEARELS